MSRQNLTSVNQKTTSTNPHTKKLSQIFLSPRHPKEMESFLQDFFSPSEIKQLAERWYIGDLLLKELTQRDVKDELRVSISKVSRVSYMIQHGTGAFRRVWDYLNKLS
jgi:Trp operon repressor